MTKLSIMSPYSQFLEACEMANISVLSDENCARLLAITYIYGGSMEAFTKNQKLVDEILYAQRKLNIMGGEAPNFNHIKLINKYIKELESFYQNTQYLKDSESPFATIHPDWVVDFMSERYNITKLWR